MRVDRGLVVDVLRFIIPLFGGRAKIKEIGDVVEEAVNVYDTGRVMFNRVESATFIGKGVMLTAEETALLNKIRLAFDTVERTVRKHV